MISDHEAKAMGHSRILEFHKFFSEYQIWLDVNSERFAMKIRIFETNDGRFFFTQSHTVHIPDRDGGLHPTDLHHATSHLALSTAVDSITTYYEDGIAEGHMPSMNWFIPNTGF